MTMVTDVHLKQCILQHTIEKNLGMIILGEKETNLQQTETLGKQ